MFKDEEDYEVGREIRVERDAGENILISFSDTIDSDTLPYPLLIRMYLEGPPAMEDLHTICWGVASMRRYIQEEHPALSEIITGIIMEGFKHDDNTRKKKRPYDRKPHITLSFCKLDVDQPADECKTIIKRLQAYPHTTDGDGFEFYWEDELDHEGEQKVVDQTQMQKIVKWPRRLAGTFTRLNATATLAYDFNEHTGPAG